MNNEEILNIIHNSKGVSIDTRTLEKGNVFFALKGDNFDGNKFVDNAIEKGANLVVCSDKKYLDKKNVIVVRDTLKSLQELANMYRKRFNIPVIAITGTNGKTTTKELLCTILSGKYNVLCTKGNLNNHIGVPLTLLGLKAKYQFAVVEMGASAPGEIDFLCNIAEPNYGVITSIGTAHILGFGSLENIIKTKMELFDYLKKNGGLFFYNKVIQDLSIIINKDGCSLGFDSTSLEGKAINSIELKKAYPFISLSLHLITKVKKNIETKLYGKYNFNNIVTAVKIADYFGVESGIIKKQLESCSPKNNRSQILDWNTNKVILDAYNANPTSMKEALKSFVEIEEGKEKILVLGDMLELGDVSLDEHIRIIDFVTKEKCFKKIVLIGSEFFNAYKASGVKNEIIHLFENSKEAKQEILSLDLKKALILAKGSRGIKIESIFL